jgi:hypothetical protein
MSIASLPLQMTTFGAVNSSNTGLPDMSIAGIFGVGFPYPNDNLLVNNLLITEIGGVAALQNLTGSAKMDFVISNLPRVSPLIPGMIIHDMLEEPVVVVRVLRLFASVRRLIGMY